ncbi:MAG TPA: hypothetical protein VKB46_15265, partial [Pyrinomonadaceae bacterium]|nr:hypothetical protein [Pyrinomonadaceae bacterium]
TQDTYYLKGQSTDYPTAMLDFDGNERASVHLRDCDINLLHILLQQLQREDLPPKLREPVTKTFFATIDRRRPQWQSDLADLQAEMDALHRSIEQQRKLVEALPKKFTREEVEVGRDDAAKRASVKLDHWLREEREYTDYITTLRNLLSLSPANFTPAKLKLADVIHKQAMGDTNSIYQLQNYIAGIGPAGLVLNKDGSLDMERSFVHINYFSLLLGSSVRNNVQDGISNRPIDMIATRLSAQLIRPQINDENITDDVIWVNSGPDKQALLLSRADAQGQLSFRYQPIKNLVQDENGKLHFELTNWQPDLPLRLFEDRQLAVPSGDREAWLNQWHTEVEWLRAVHKTHYSNGLIGLNEELARHPFEKLAPDQPGISADESLMRRFVRRQRRLVEPDLLIVANNHWNFDVRGFNPGGNHGSFFRISTHSVFMVCGGRKVGVAEGAIVSEPYDSLSFVPTMLALTGNLRDDSSPIPILWEKGFRRFPGRLVKELLPPVPGTEKITVTGANSSP